MADLAARLKPLFRRSSTFSSTKSSASGSSTTSDALGDSHNWSKSSTRLSKNRKASLPVSVFEENEPSPQSPGVLPSTPTEEARLKRGNIKQTPDTSPETPRSPPLEKQNPTFTVEAPTPKLGTRLGRTLEEESPSPRDSRPLAETDAGATIGSQRPSIAHRRKSLTNKGQSRDISSLLGSKSPALRPTKTSYFGGISVNADMIPKKIWVKRPGSSATQVTIKEDDLVDDVRDTILRKYNNSLGRNFDPPDVTLRMVYRKLSARNSNSERTLGPEEPMLKLLELHYPGGQSVEEALIIDVPKRQTPRHSPRMAMPYYLPEDYRPHENGTDYFPPMPLAAQHSPHLPTNLSVTSAQGSLHHPPAHSMAVLTTGQLPNLPSPGGRARHSQNNRPRYGRQHTSSPTVIQGGSIALNHENLKASQQSMPTPPIPEEMTPHKTATPPPRVASPRPKPNNNKRTKKQVDQAPQPANTAVPPINVLIVEDNIINLRLLEAFMKRLKVRWSTAMNGRDAVTKWREGGYHLVLMDIQLPVMNGLDATKEIRRLERVNSIGVFSSSASSTPTFANGAGIDGTVEGVDSLMNTALFKSPVIIVALTASSLQSDRHEALAAGCNDFLTKPVNFEWLTRKVMEWGCMQALIDFDGWRKWKDFSQTKPANAEKKAIGANNNIKSPKAALNGKAQSTPKRDRLTSLGVGGKENTGSDGTGTDTLSNGDSGSGNEATVRG
ncbi:MAG: ssk1 response regulator receiver [Alectoria sarmentosa]|nr:MAG: ssk1 response regulator receiver [Alectoria sarmentosa]